MKHTPEAEVVDWLIRWADARADIRAVILTSSRARADGTVDVLSDYDVILAVTEVDAFAGADAWQSEYGPPMVRWGDESPLYGRATFFRGVVYQDGSKIDYTIWPDELLDEVAGAEKLPEDLDVGYRVLVDKDGRTSAWASPSYRAHIPDKPTEREYQALVEEFFWGTTYAAKSLWRGELPFAKFVLEFDLKLMPLRRFLEWRIELDNDWSVRPGVFGRGLERLLPAHLWSELAATYVGIDPADNWAALDRTVSLFRRVATEVGDRLGYAYPQDVDDQVMAYVRSVRELPGVVRS